MENQSNQIKITVKDIINIIFRKKIMITIIFIFGIFITIIAVQFITPVYDANVKMLIRGQNVVTSELYEAINTRGLQATQAEIVKSAPVLKRAAIALDLQNRPFDYEKNYCSNLKKYLIDRQVKKTEEKLKNLTPEKLKDLKLDFAIGDLEDRLSVKVLPGTNIFIINVTAFTPEEAMETANVISRSYTMFDQIQQLAEVRLRYGESHPTVIQLVDNIKELTNNLSGRELPDIEAIGTASVKIIEQATSSYSPVSKSKRIIFSAALFISATISLGLALLSGLLNKNIKTPQEIADHLNIPCIGSIPKKRKKDAYLITDSSPYTKYYHFYEELSEQLFVFLRTQGLKVIVLSSPVKNINHKYIVPNIAYFLSSIMGNKVLLVEANFNNPNFQNVFSINENLGIDGDTLLNDSRNIIKKTDTGLEIIPAKMNSAKPANILKKINFKNFIESTKDKYDVIIIDATSINYIKEISLISEYSDGTVIIIDEDKLQKDMLKNSLNRLRRNEKIFLGAILNNRTFPVPEFIYKNFKYFID